MRRIGLLGGTSWESSAHYYTQLNEGVAQRLGGLHSADLLLRSVDFAEIEQLQRAGDWTALGARYEVEARALVAAGAQVVGILANTMHLVHDDVVRGAGVPVPHVVDAVASAATGLGVRRLALLGTRYTMESSLYPDRVAAHGLTVSVPSGADAAETNRIIYEELCRGVVRDESRAALQRVAGRLVDEGADSVVLGCTELAMILGPDDLPVPVLDSTALHVHSLLEAALEPRTVHERGAA
ncbi:aspartate/glutamate racemase family protein [uncultured Cellulomonas sp.]|uniref:aspartate/glutamate racemase family protein n=1 Tax=uncultured Cellulomonas sp. TaxID=189682 RepID=UPI002611487B|nr:aspartate/glutamate racemase family protein [uncultured Cellulomonas sp.]